VAYWLFKIVLSPIMFLVYRVRPKHRAAIPRTGGAILAANHQAFCDSLFLPLVVLRRKVTFLAKAEYFDDPKTAWFFRAAGQIPIRRGGGSASERALETALDVLGSGRLIALYPEGTRSLDEYVHKGRTGVARMALRSGCPVVPVGLRGTSEVQPVGQNWMRPFRKVTVVFGDPMYLHPGDVSAAASEQEALRDFTDRLMHTIAELSERPYLDEYIPKKGRS
jgi:1-acyl-sn-glycerol-3-phosphate acyltransferase